MRARSSCQRMTRLRYRDALQDYFDRAQAGAPGLHTPHLLDEALSWHSRYLREGSMRPGVPAAEAQASAR